MSIARSIDPLPHHLHEAVRVRSSRLSGFHKLAPSARRAVVAQWAGLAVDEAEALNGVLPTELGDALIENAVGGFALPVGIATNFCVNSSDVLVPMAIEEPSVVAAASFGALLVRKGGGFTARADDPVMIGQVQVLDLPDGDLDAAAARLQAVREAVLIVARATSETLPRLGGGAKDLEVRLLRETAAGPMLVAHLLYDTRDAMGANAVNTACEAVAPLIAEATGGRVGLRILSNLADRRLVRASCCVPAEALEGRGAAEGVPGSAVVARIVEANAFAVADPYRASTHNKGIMNGIDPVVIVTGNDWRAAEAGAHAYAARDGAYRALTDWRVGADGDLHGSIELPLALGIVGGTTRSHPAAQVALKVLGVTSALELAEVAACVGLAQNLSALRALASEGIQHGHMALHARQLALAAGVSGEDAAAIADLMVAENDIRLARARELVAARSPGSTATST